MTPTANPFESAARERKVTDMVNALLRGHYRLLAERRVTDMVAVVGAVLATACGFTDAEWAALAAATGHRPPSDTTTAAVLGRLEGMLPSRANTDPFEGLGEPA